MKRLPLVLCVMVVSTSILAAAEDLRERVAYLKSNYKDVVTRVAQEASAMRLFGSGLPEVYSNFEENKGLAYYSFTGTLPYVFDPLRQRDSVRAGALWVAVAKPVAQIFWKLGGSIQQVDGVKIQIRTSSTDSRMPLTRPGGNEVITYFFTTAELRRFFAGEIADADLFSRSQITFNGSNMKVDFTRDAAEIATLAQNITLFRERYAQ